MFVMSTIDKPQIVLKRSGVFVINNIWICQKAYASKRVKMKWMRVLRNIFLSHIEEVSIVSSYKKQDHVEVSFGVSRHSSPGFLREGCEFP